MKAKMKNPQKPLKLSKGLNPKTPTSANPAYTLIYIIYIYIHIYTYIIIFQKLWFIL